MSRHTPSICTDDILSALDRVAELEDAKLEARKLMSCHAPLDVNNLDNIWEAISQDDFKLLHVASDTTTSQNTERFERLLELIFYLGLEAEWPRGVREAGLLKMQLLVDVLQRFDDAIAWASLVMESTDNQELHQLASGDMGLALIYKGDLGAAIRSITMALELARKRTDHYFVAKYLGDLGAAYSRNRSFKEAEECLGQAISIGRSVPNFEHVAKFERDLNTVQEAIRAEHISRHYQN